MTIPADDPHPRKKVPVLDSAMSYVDVGKGRPVVFLHGNPTSSYLWRNVIAHVARGARCLAPDLVGMGASDKAPDGTYRFVDHARYLAAWADAVPVGGDAVIVGHDWGVPLGLQWAREHADRVAGVVHMEGVVVPRLWSEMPDATRDFFRSVRSPAGEALILGDNHFVEQVLPRRVLRRLGEEEMAVYRRPYPTPESRLPTLVWPREIPIDGEPQDVRDIVEANHAWMLGSPLPKLFVRADPGGVIFGRSLDACRSYPNQREVTVAGSHFLQEDSPAEIGDAIAAFVAALP